MACAGSLRFRTTVVPLAAVGSFSLIVYLYHLIGISAGERLALAASLPSLLVLVAKLAVGLAAPIALELAARRVPGAGFVVLGVRSRPRTGPSGGSGPGGRAPEEQADQGVRPDRRWVRTGPPARGNVA